MTTIDKVISSMALALLIGAGIAQRRPVRPADDQTPPTDVLEVIAAQPELSIFTEAVKAAGLDRTLRRKGPWTVLAPTNEAFRTLPAGTLTEWSKPENRSHLAEVIEYHVIRGNLQTGSISTAEVQTLQGSRVVLKETDGIVWVGHGEVVKPGLQGTNGVVHVINVVLEPDEM